MSEKGSVAQLTTDLRQRANLYSRLAIYAASCDQSKMIDVPRLLKILEGVTDSKEGIKEIVKSMYEVDKYDLMNLVELRIQARRFCIFGYQSMNKGELLVRIKKILTTKEARDVEGLTQVASQVSHHEKLHQQDS